jgi:uncharacterized protein (DUF1810 family)
MLSPSSTMDRSDADCLQSSPSAIDTVRPFDWIVHDWRMAYDLDRFVIAQRHAFDGALAELRAGRKTGHWIWFIFPQVAGLGHSQMSQFYGIASLAEARAYLADPVLGPRLRACAEAVLAVAGRTAVGILGPVDAMKLRSSMTLFHLAAQDEAVFGNVLDRYFAGVPDPATEALIS